MSGARRARTVWLAVLLAAAVTLVYLPVAHHPFADVDDRDYVAENPVVRGGLSAAGVAWAFGSVGYAHNWHPLTWISHMADVSLFGMNPAGHHVVNLLLHAANTVLLFVTLHSLTGVLWPAFAAAALFGVHPLHVESVAWVAERKDVLSTFFALLTLIAWIRHLRRPAAGRYLAALAVYALALLAKPMPVTLPLLLLLLDGWPLGRFPGSVRRARGELSGWAGLLAEKVPFAMLAVATGALTWRAQSGKDMMPSWVILPGGERAANALVSICAYLRRSVWPIDLAMFYPHPRGTLSAGQVVTAGVFVAGVTLLTLLAARRRPWLAAGWGWFLIGLLPVLGVVQVGPQGMADRYTYLPLTGIFVAVCWSGAEAVRRWPPTRTPLAAAAPLALVLLMAAGRRQVDYWRSPEVLYRHAIDAVPRNWLAHNNLGLVLAGQGLAAEAEGHYREALAIQSDYPAARHNLAVLLMRRGALDEALQQFDLAEEAEPQDPVLLYNHGVALSLQGLPGPAAERFARALAIRPDLERARRALAALERRTGPGREPARPNDR